MLGVAPARLVGLDAGQCGRFERERPRPLGAQPARCWLAFGDGVGALVGLLVFLARAAPSIGQRRTGEPAETHLAPVAGDGETQDPAGGTTRLILHRQARNASNEVQTRLGQPGGFCRNAFRSMATP